MMLIPHEQGLQMMPWLMFAETQEIVINKSHVMAVYMPRLELVNGYQQQTGGVVTAPANALDKKGQLVL